MFFFFFFSLFLFFSFRFVTHRTTFYCTFFARTAADLSKEVQCHLLNVYLALLGTLFSTVVGVKVHFETDIGGGLGVIGVVTTVICLCLSHEINLTRGLILVMFGFFEGLAIGPYMQTIMAIDPTIPVTAAVATTAVFVSFSLSVLLTNRRSYLFLGAMLVRGPFVFSLFFLLFFWPGVPHLATGFYRVPCVRSTRPSVSGRV